MYDLNVIKGYLVTKYIGQTIIQFDELKSTNIKAKSIFDKCPNGTVVLSEHQSNCKVRFGIEWNSYPDKNIYLSIILKPKIENYMTSKYETMASASVCESVRYIFNNLECKMKWPNDILIDDKKISVVYCELVKTKKNIEGIIISIGVNVNLDENDIDDEMKQISTSIKIEAQNDVDREMLIGCILNNFEIHHDELINYGNINKSINICVNNSMLIGNNIEITRQGKKTARKVFVSNMDSNGNLVVINDKGNEEIINSGEVTVKYEGKA